MSFKLLLIMMNIFCAYKMNTLASWRAFPAAIKTGDIATVFRILAPRGAFSPEEL